MHIGRVTSGLVIESALVVEQGMVVVDTRDDFRFDETHDAVANGNDILRKIECDGAHDAVLARAAASRAMSAHRPI